METSVGINHVDNIAVMMKPGTKNGIEPILNFSPSTFVLLFAIIAHNGTIMTNNETLDNFTVVAITIASGPILSPAAIA